MTVAAVMAAATTTAVTVVMTAKTARAKKLKWVYLMSHQIFAVIHEIHGFV